MAVHSSRAVCELVRDLRFREADPGGAVTWLLKVGRRQALIVPTMLADGTYSFLCQVQQRTLDLALDAELIQLGPLKTLPPYVYGKKAWRYIEGRRGRAVVLRDGRFAFPPPRWDSYPPGSVMTVVMTPEHADKFGAKE